MINYDDGTIGGEGEDSDAFEDESAIYCSHNQFR